MAYEPITIPPSPAIFKRATSRSSPTPRRTIDKRIAEAYFDLTQESIFIISVTPREEFKFIYLNRTHEDATGLFTEDLQDRQPSECLPSDIANVVTENYRRCVRSGTAISYEETLSLPAGKRTWETTLHPVRDPFGRIDLIIGVSHDITEDSAAESAQSRFLLERIGEADPNIIYILDLESQKLSYLSARGTNHVENLGSVVGLSLSDHVKRFVHPDDQKKVLSYYCSGRPFPKKNARIEYRIKNIHGGYHWWSDTHSALAHAGATSIKRIIGVLSDIDEQHAAAQKLLESEKQFQLMANTVPDVLFIADAEGKLEYCNHVIEAFAGLTPKQLKKRNWRKYFHPEDRKTLFGHLADNGLLECEARIKDQSDRYRWFLIRARPFQSADGTVVKWFGSATDIDQLKRTQVDLQSANINLRTTVSAISDCYITVDRNLVVCDRNERAVEWFGSHSPDFNTIRAPSTLSLRIEKIRHDIETVISTRVPLNRELRSVIHRDRWVSIAIHPTERGAAIFFKDITTRKAEEACTKEALWLLQESIDALSSQIAIVDQSGKIELVNKAWQRHFEPMEDQGDVGTSYRGLYTCRTGQADALTIEQGLRDVLSGRRREFRHILHNTAPENKWFQVKASRFHTAGRNYVIVAHEDITAVKTLAEERRRINQQLLRTQNAERQRIARELHDSTAQHITAVGLGLARLKKHATTPEAQNVLADVRQCLQEAHNELRSMTYLLHPPAIDGPNVAASLERFLHGFAGRTGLKVVFDCPGNVLMASDDMQLAIYRIVQEALVNVSRHANANTVVVRLRSNRKSIGVEVKDDGKGIFLGNDGGQLRLEGLGIPGMRARVEQFGGRFSIRRLQRGTKVRAVLPLQDEAALN